MIPELKIMNGELKIPSNFLTYYSLRQFLFKTLTYETTIIY